LFANCNETGTAENLTTLTKSAVINASLCYRQTEIIGPLPTRNDESAKNFSCRPASFPLLRISFLVICFLLSLSSALSARGQPTEYQIKAAFLFNFAKFVEWPPAAFPDANSPIVIGVLGKNVFGTDLETTIRNKTVNNRPFRFETLDSVAQATNCHILFVSPSEKDNFPAIIAALHNASILTVSETDPFIKAGGMINFTIQDNKVRFQIDDEAAKKAGLKISSKLLTLAVH